MKTKQIIFIILGIVALGALLTFTASLSKQTASAYWNDTSVPCLPNGHENIALHIHPTLTVYVQGEEVPVGANIGISNTCMAEVHTHEPGGTIHIESTNPNQTYTVADFFTVLGEELYIEGFTLTATVNGESEASIETYPLKDGDAVVLSYELETL